MIWGMCGSYEPAIEPAAPKVGRPHRDRAKIKAARKANRRTR